MKPKKIAVALILFTVLSIIAPAASAQSLPPQAAWQANAHQLANQVLDLIQRVEKSPLDCQIRNLIVHRLRLLHDAITSGRGTAARGFLIAWLRNVRNMQGAQLITAEQGSAVQVELMNLLKQVGEGWPAKPQPTRNWPKLPSCDAAPRKATTAAFVSEFSDSNRVLPAATATGSYNGPVFTLDDTKYILDALVSEIPIAGKILGPLVHILWPESGPDINSLIDDAIDSVVKGQAEQDLINMQRSLNNFLDVEVNNPSQAGSYFVEAQGYIYAGLGTFMWNHTATGGKDYRIEFLPLFAQAENLYLALLREAALHGAEWQGWEADDVTYWKDRMQAELDVNDPTKGTGYAMDIYKMGLNKQPTGSGQSDWTKRNTYVREKTLGVLDFTEIWKYMDPYDYPNGVPNLKLTRMIYSDPVGTTEHTFVIPHDAYGPLRNLTVWLGNQAKFVDAVQETGGPTAGPIITSAIMGDSGLGDSQTRYDFDVSPGGAKGPISTVNGYSAMFLPCQSEFLSALSFTFADGTSSGRIGSEWPELWMWGSFTPCPNKYMTSSTYSFSYPGEVVASVQVMGSHKFPTGTGADSVVFGFRYADSYYPSGQAVNAQTSGCLKAMFAGAGAPVVLGSILDCANQLNYWTYNSALHQLTTFGVSHDVEGVGNFCLDTDAAGNAILNPCNDGPTQRWDITASGVGGTIGRGGLVLTPTLGALKLAADTASASQRWRTPNQVQGPVNAVVAGQCLGVNPVTAGTYANIYACTTGFTPGQTWTYSLSMGTLSLTAGTMCLDAPGTPVKGARVQVNACNASDSQQWLLKPDARIQHVKSGLYLDLYGYTGTSVPPVLWDDTNTNSQKWTWPMY